MNVSTNGVIALLRALTHETRRVERLMETETADEETVDEMGHYLGDLQEVISAAAATYHQRSGPDCIFSSADELLELFAKEEFY